MFDESITPAAEVLAMEPTVKAKAAAKPTAEAKPKAAKAKAAPKPKAPMPGAPPHAPRTRASKAPPGAAAPAAPVGDASAAGGADGLVDDLLGSELDTYDHDHAAMMAPMPSAHLSAPSWAAANASNTSSVVTSKTESLHAIRDRVVVENGSALFKEAITGVTALVGKAMPELGRISLTPDELTDKAVHSNALIAAIGSSPTDVP